MSAKLECITGCMFSGKSEELVRRLRRAVFAKQKVIAIKPMIDNRYSSSDIASHAGSTFPCVAIPDCDEILTITENASVIGIDEAQFFTDRLIPVVRTLLQRGKRVIIAGLDMDSKGVPFEPIPYFMATADDLVKVSAICTSCGEAATHTHRTSHTQGRILVGADRDYVALCRQCWTAAQEG